jgi:hypothetical protein
VQAPGNITAVVSIFDPLRVNSINGTIEFVQQDNQDFVTYSVLISRGLWVCNLQCAVTFLGIELASFPIAARRTHALRLGQ